MHLAPPAFRCLTLLAVLVAGSRSLDARAATNASPLFGSGIAQPASSVPAAGAITPVDPATIPCVAITTFEDLAGGSSPGTNYDGVVFSAGVYFAERFAGQSVGSNGDFDVVSGTPSSPLALAVGAAGQNLEVFADPTNVLTGLGHIGYPDIDAIGEGAIAMWFPSPQSQVSLQVVGGNGGTATLQFYRIDGSLIDTVTLTGVGDLAYGFVTTDGTPTIAGILVQNTDPGGIGIDNVCHDAGITGTRSSTWGGFKAIYR